MKYEIPNPALSEVEGSFYNFVPLHTGVYPRCKLTCFPVGGPFEPVHQPAKRPGIRKPRKRNSTKDYVRIYKLFMQNKANFMRYSPENDDFTKKQTQLKPIQSQFKANLTQNKPNLSQFKPNLTQNKPN